MLDLCGNQIKRAGALAAARAVADKPALQLLALDENEVSEAGVEAVREVSGGGEAVAARAARRQGRPAQLRRPVRRQ